MASEDDPTSTPPQRKSLSFHERHIDEWGKQKNGREIRKGAISNICLEKQK
jgi:hypothetical protein